MLEVRGEETGMPDGQEAQVRTQDVEVLRESGVHKLLIAGHDGNCLAYLLAWDSFGYDPETDTYMCVVDPDGRELMTLCTAGEVKPEPGTNRYLVTAPTAEAAAELSLLATDLAI
jgi:hypothetical protein